MKVGFRRVRAGDLKRLNHIVNDPEVAHFLMVSPPVSMKSTRLLYREILRDKSLWYAILVDSAIAGSVTLRRMSAEKNAHTVDLGIALAKEYWGMGIGGIAVDYMVRKAKASGMKRVQLTVTADNERAVALYRRHGFRKEGHMRKAFKVGGRYLDVCLMARLLP